MQTNKAFAELAQRYLDERRALGYGLTVAGHRLLAFARFADSHSAWKSLTVELAVTWARASKRASPLTWARRLEIVRPFAQWLRQHDPATEVPPSGIFGRPRRRLPPHVYTEAEIGRMLDEADRLTPHGGMRPAAVRTLLGLLACTGMRVSEALALEIRDVDLSAEVLHVRRSKFRKSRLVPLHHTTVRALNSYFARRTAAASPAAHAPFFIVDRGVCLTYSKTRTAFRRIRSRLGWEARPGRPPRIHDLRHTFACRRLLLWHQETVDVDAHILDLSTYLGHAKPSDTYWYLSAFPDLLALASQRFERFATEGVGS
jgi:integrase